MTLQGRSSRRDTAFPVCRGERCAQFSATIWLLTKTARRAGGACAAAIRQSWGCIGSDSEKATDLKGLSLDRAGDVPRVRPSGIPSWRDGNWNVDLRRTILGTVFLARPARELRRCFPPDFFRLRRDARIPPASCVATVGANSEETRWGDAFRDGRR